MVQSRNRPAPSEWEKIRLELKDMYLGQNLTLKTIEQRFAERGFVATTRQYKTKLKAWGYDDKTIKHPLWHSMYVVMRSRMDMGISSAFLVPIRGGGTTVIRSDRILKEINRNKSVHDWANVQRAEEVLREADVVYCSDNDRDIELHQQAARPAKTTQPFGLDLNNQPQGLNPIDRQSSGDTVASSSQSAFHGMHGKLPATDFAREPEWRPDGVLSEPTSSMPSKIHSPESYYSRPMPYQTSPTNSKGRSVSVPSQPGANDQDMLSVMSSLFLDPSSSNPFRGIAPNSKGDSVGFLIEEERKLGVRWLAPYICDFLNRGSAQYRTNKQHREDAQNAFQEMLKRNNRYIFPYFNWMFTVLVCNNQTVLLNEFLENCCDVIDRADMGYDLTYGPPLKLALAMYTGNQRGVEVHRSSFLSSANAIRMIWGSDSPNYLVHQYYYAWLMLEQQQNQEALTILRDCLPLSERIMGHQHIITINCLAILARAFDENRLEAEAVATLQDLLSRLSDCSDLLQAYKYRQLVRLADHQVRSKNLQQAEATLRDVLTFRSRSFGMNASATWEAVVKLKDVLNLQGRTNESTWLVQQHHSQYDEEREDEWRSRHEAPPPWLRGP